MEPIFGGCHCGTIFVQVVLTRDTSQYAPRACDCSYCRKHGAAYVSDPKGRMVIHIKDEQRCQRYRQGSGSAEMVLCRECGVLIGAIYRDVAWLYGTINVTAMDSSLTWGTGVTASPQQLSAPEKVERWKALWFADVALVGGGEAK